MPTTAQIKICTRCVLPETFPGISFDSQGFCTYCQKAPPAEELAEQTAALKRNLDEVIQRSKGRGIYDCVVAYSGGKDSTYTLKHLVEHYQLSCLAVTIDNGFLSEGAKSNCRTVTQKLGVDFLMFTPAPQFMNNLYVQSKEQPQMHSKAAITRASSICTSCITLINSYVVRLAIQNGAPMIAGGYIGGQVPTDMAVLELDPKTYDLMRAPMLERFAKYLGDEAYKYLRIGASGETGKIAITNPMLTICVSEEEIIEDIGQLGWVPVKDTGRNSSNCRLNDFAIVAHFEKYGFNPYVLEISEQVRRGVMSRQHGIAKAHTIPSRSDVQWQAERLGLEWQSHD